MRILLKVVVFLLVFNFKFVSLADVTIKCTFKPNQEIWKYQFVLEKFMVCDLQDDLTASSVIIEAIGDPGDTEPNTTEVFVVREKVIHLIPDGLATVFPKLVGINIENSDFSVLTDKEMKNLPNLKFLTIKESKLSVIVGGTFTKNINLELIDFSGNMISFIATNAFEGLLNLVYLNLDGIMCLFGESAVADTETEVSNLMSLAGEKCMHFEKVLNDAMRNLLVAAEENENCELGSGNETDCPDDCAKELEDLKKRYDENLDNLEGCKNETEDLNSEILELQNNITKLEEYGACDYSNGTCKYKEVTDFGYSCIAKGISIKTEKDQILDWYGSHTSEKNNDNVLSLIIESQDVEMLPINLTSAFKNLAKLVIRSSGLNRIKKGELNTLTKLQSLTITGNYLTLIESGAFSGLAALIELDLSRNNIISLPSKIFETLNIKILNLSDNKLTILRYDWILSNNIIDKIYLNNNPLTSVDSTFIWRLQRANIIDLTGTKCNQLRDDYADPDSTFMDFFTHVYKYC